MPDYSMVRVKKLECRWQVAASSSELFYPWMPVQFEGKQNQRNPHYCNADG